MKLNTRPEKRNIMKYSREQQVVLLLLAALAFVAVALDVFLPVDVLAPESEFKMDSMTVESISRLYANLDSVKYADYARQPFSESKQTYGKHVDTIKYRSFPFDPNTADSASLLSLGFKPRVVKNILKYRQAGGVFRDIDGLKRIYGIDTARVEALRNFIIFPENEKDSADDKRLYRPPKEYFDFELNGADTAELKRFPGIGSARANAIVAYRYRLGGFYSVEQLYEIDEFPDSVVGRLRQYATLDVKLIRKINLNKTGIKQLRRHPYINYYQAKEIYEMRWDETHKGRLEKSDILRLKSMTKEEVERLMPYLSFE